MASVFESHDNPSSGSGNLPFPNADRWQLIRSIKNDADGETILCYDRETRKNIILKTVPEESVSKTMFKRLENRVAIMRGLNNPHLSPILEIGQDDNLIFLIRPFVDGITLSAKLRMGPIGVEETLTIGLAVLSGLQDIHRMGLLHRNVSPNHVLVDETIPIGRVALLDVWQPVSDQIKDSLPPNNATNAKYMPPERAGLLARELNESSDIYSFGVLMFECLAGRPPFDGHGSSDILKQHLTAEPSDLTLINPAVPQALNKVIQRCLRKDPANRYQTAGAVLADLSFIRDARGRGVVDPTLVTGLFDRRKTLTDPDFIGREAELTLLKSHLDNLNQCGGGLIFVESESGCGKSALLNELTRHAARRGILILTGQGQTKSAQRPLQNLLGIVEHIAGEMRSNPAFEKN